ncbi:MAG: chromosomal replication initiator protein DnaA [Candidatus Pacebacteria bacterium]|nr:chromosomal replication initiator protein DnaA [Candidatus Paceibacterota bacterium]
MAVEQLLTDDTVAAPSPTAAAEDRQLWAQVIDKIRDKLGESTFRSWIKQVEFSHISQVAQNRSWALSERAEPTENTEMVAMVHLHLPNKFMRDYVSEHFGTYLIRYWQEVLGRDCRIEFGLKKKSTASRTQAKLQRGDEQSPGPEAPTDQNSNDSQPMPSLASGSNDYADTQLDSRNTFENFVVGKPNELAFAAARRVAEFKGDFNPLFLYGGVGLGKTHLMHAIAWEIRTKFPDRRVIYMSAEKFMNHFINALRYKNMASFKQEFRTVDVLMIDDVQFICGKDNTQEEFFHTFNALVDLKHRIVISADKSPSDLELDERLRSRLGWGLVADIHPSSYELRLGILKARAERQKIEIADSVLAFLAHKISSNIRELEGAFNRITAYIDLIGMQVTVEMAQDILRDLLRANERQVTIEEIQKRVAAHYMIRQTDMTSPRRARNVARPRQIAMYLAKQLTQSSLPDIGRKFGGRDHTTVIHAVRKVESLVEKDQSMAEDIELLKRLLSS